MKVVAFKVSLVNSSVLDGVLQIEKSPNFLSRIIWVNQHGATLQQVAISSLDLSSLAQCPQFTHPHQTTRTPTLDLALTTYIAQPRI